VILLIRFVKILDAKNLAPKKKKWGPKAWKEREDKMKQWQQEREEKAQRYAQEHQQGEEVVEGDQGDTKPKVGLSDS